MLWVARHRPSELEGVRQLNPRAISARLDRPRFDGLEGSPHLGLLGWAYARTGIESVDVYLDGQLARAAEIGRARPDVTSAWRHLDESEIEGFSAVIPLSGSATGDRLLSVAIRDGAGDVRILSRRFHRLDVMAAYQHFRRRVLSADVAEPRTQPELHLFVAAREGGDLGATLRSVAASDVAPGRCTILAGPDRSEAAGMAALEAMGSHAGWSWGISSRPASALPEVPSPRRLVGLLLAGEVLDPSALTRLAQALEAPATDLAYADHDAFGDDGQHRDPWFVPDWSPHRFLAQDYIGGGFLLRDGPALRSALDGDLLASDVNLWRYALLLRASAEAANVVHVALPLWSCPAVEPSDPVAATEVVRVELERRGFAGAEVSTRGGPLGPSRSVRWPAPSPSPLVSVIVPTTGRRELVVDLLHLLEQGTAYERKELVVLDNSRGRNPDGISLLREARATVIERDEPFNWARLSNAGATQAAGELLLFLNDDVQAVGEGWLDALVRGISPADVGAVGPLLLYPDGTIQHAGIFLVGLGGGAAHLLQGLDPADDLYLDLQYVTREVSAVTGACLLVRRVAFEAIDGFDERYQVSGNDVDFCLRLWESGRRVLWTPNSVLQHAEGRSRRGVDYLADEGRLWDRWGDLLRNGDPYFNPNLAQDRVDCDLAWVVSDA